MAFTRSFFSTACVLLFAIGCGGDDGGGGTDDESSSGSADDDDATMTDATLTATMTDATVTVGEDSSSSGGADSTGDSGGTDTGGSSGTDTGADSGSGTDSSGTETGAAMCGDVNGMMACNETKGCIFLNGDCTAIEDAACDAAEDEETCALLPQCAWNARDEVCEDA